MEPLAGKEEVATILGVSPQTLDNWASLGKGPTYAKVGGHRKYDLVDVREWIEARKVRRRQPTEREVRRNLEELRAKGLIDYDPEADHYRINDLGRRVLEAGEAGGK